MVVGYLPFPGDHPKARGIFIGPSVLHEAELPAALKIGSEKGLGAGDTAVKTLFFGITWWVPVKKGIIGKYSRPMSLN